MATFNWPGFGISSISPTFDQPSQSNSSAWTGTRTVITDPWHGKWSFKVTLATQQGDGAFQAIRAFFTSLKGQINTFHLPAVEAPQNANTGVTLSAGAAQGAASIALTGLTTALVPGNMVTIAGQLLSLTTVGSLSGTAQTINFEPTLRVAAASGASVETARPYALVYLSDSSFSWDIGQWRRYGLTFNAAEAVGETDGAAASGDTWNATFSGSGGGSPVYTGVAVQKDGGTLSQATALNIVGASLVIAGSTANISPFVTPQQYGAAGNGTTDDTAAIQAAYAAAAAAKETFRIPGADYKISSSILFNVDGVHVEADGWEKSRFLTSAAVPAIIITSKYAIIKGIGCDGRPNGVTVTGTYGIVCKDTNSTLIEDCDARGFVNDGILFDTQFGGGITGNNNQCRVKNTSSVQNGRQGVRMEQRADNNGISFYGVNSSGNASHGMLVKSEGWYVDPNCLLEGNSGYGLQIGEDSDTSSNVNGIYDAAWNEGNTLGGVHSSASAGSNMIRLKSGITTYSRNAIAADLVDWTSGGVKYFGSSDGDAAVRVSANTTSAFLYAASKSGAVNVTLHLGAAGTGFVQSDYNFNIDTGKVLTIGNTQVVGARGAAVADAVAAVAAPTQAEFNAFVTQFNLLLARVRAATGHGLIS